MISELFWQCSISYMISKLFWQCGIFLHDFWTVLTVWYISTNHVGNTTLSEQFGNHVGNTTLSKQFRNHVEKYQTVRTVQKSYRKITHCQHNFYMISELFWQCNISYMISELFWQCIVSYIISELFWKCGIFLHDFGTALTVLSCRKYYTVRTVQKSCRKYYTVRTIRKSCRKYYTVKTIPKSCWKIPF
jgi:hypothetical protein